MGIMYLIIKKAQVKKTKNKYKNNDDKFQINMISIDTVNKIKIINYINHFTNNINKYQIL